MRGIFRAWAAGLSLLWMSGAALLVPVPAPARMAACSGKPHLEAAWGPMAAGAAAARGRGRTGRGISTGTPLAVAAADSKGRPGGAAAAGWEAEAPMTSGRPMMEGGAAGADLQAGAEVAGAALPGCRRGAAPPTTAEHSAAGCIIVSSLCVFIALPCVVTGLLNQRISPHLLASNCTRQ